MNPCTFLFIHHPSHTPLVILSSNTCNHPNINCSDGSPRSRSIPTDARRVRTHARSHTRSQLDMVSRVRVVVILCLMIYVRGVDRAPANAAAVDHAKNVSAHRPASHTQAHTNPRPLSFSQAYLAMMNAYNTSNCSSDVRTPSAFAPPAPLVPPHPTHPIPLPLPSPPRSHRTLAYTAELHLTASRTQNENRAMMK